MIEKDDLNQYVEVSKELERRAYRMKELQAEFDEANKELKDEILQCRENLQLLRDKITVQALDEFKGAPATKQLMGGIGIRVGTQYDYDAERALEWAKKHEMCLALDRRSFEAIAKVQTIDFVETSEKITVTFPKEIKLLD